MVVRVLLLALPFLLLADTPPAYTIRTIAGSDFVGDGGAAASAILSQPEGIAIDSARSLYLADADDNRIRKVSPNGLIQTIAGTGHAGFSGDNDPPPPRRSISPMDSRSTLPATCTSPT